MARYTNLTELLANASDDTRAANPDLATPAKRTTTEHDEQVALFAWAEDTLDRLPALSLLFAIPNGGYRHKATAGRMKAEGQRAGVPDICLPVPRGSYHGLYIEMKVERNKPTDAQTAWLSALTKQGYCCHVCYGAGEARSVIENYLEYWHGCTVADYGDDDE